MGKFNILLNNISSIPENLEDLKKEELIEALKKIQTTAKDLSSKGQRKNKLARPFDFKKYKKRHVALKLLYLGWDYSGFAVQDYAEETVEKHLFEALHKVKLVETRETSNYHRCGRTDKGVSAFSQVISLDLRSNFTEGVDLITPDGYQPNGRKNAEKEIDYPSVLNSVLPPEIRIIAWAPVESAFSARFNCRYRTYKYWFPKGNLDINQMKQACQMLIGEHDFRNFCKMDVGNNVLTYVRKICQMDIVPVSSVKKDTYQLYELSVIGTAFLWHQIRCIIKILFLIGQGKEDLKVISELLDVKKFPRKPQYSMASEIPLVLFDCEFENINWIYDEDNIKIVIKQLQSIWTQHSVKTTIIRRMLSVLENVFCSGKQVVYQADSLLPGMKPRVYKKLLSRPTCDSLEEKIIHYEKRRENECSNSSKKQKYI